MVSNIAVIFRTFLRIPWSLHWRAMRIRAGMTYTMTFVKVANAHHDFGLTETKRERQRVKGIQGHESHLHLWYRLWRRFSSIQFPYQGIASVNVQWSVAWGKPLSVRTSQILNIAAQGTTARLVLLLFVMRNVCVGKILGEKKDERHIDTLVLHPPENLRITKSDGEMLERHREVFRALYVYFVPKSRWDAAPWRPATYVPYD